ncbi:MAG: glycosyltransferase [Paracoccaceae bacterium]
MSGPLAILAAGGTGGHLFPAEAVAHRLLERGWRVTLATDDRGLRYATGFPEAVRRLELRSATLARGGLTARLALPVTLARGIGAALLAFRRDTPAIVAGFGGYPSIPALAAATLMGLPRLIHEQNGTLGRVNRAFASRVNRVACGSWPLRDPPRRAALQPVGNPVRAPVREAARIPYAMPGDGPLSLLIFGGSQGAHALARLMPETVALLPEPVRRRLAVTHQIRPEDMDEAVAAYRAAEIPEPAVAPFFDDLPERIARAHLVVARAGAMTIAELETIGRPSILVPLPSAMDDHQTANARPLAEAGAAILAPEADTDAGAMAGHLRAVLLEPWTARAMAAAAHARARPDADRTLADLLEELAGPGARP